MGLDVRDFTLTTFGGSGSLLLCRLMDILGIGTVLVPPDPGNVSAFGLLTVDVKNDYVQTHVALADALDPTSVAEILDALTARADDALAKEGFAAADHRYARTADLRYFGQAFEVRVPVPDGPIDAAVLDEVARPLPRRAQGPLRLRLRRRRRASRSSGSTSGSPASARSSGRRSAATTRIRTRAVEERGVGVRSASTRRRGTSTRRCSGAPTCPVGAVVAGPAIIEEFGSTVPLHPGFTARIDDYRNIIVTRKVEQ